uniref:guanine nucleotide-binding protein-like 3 n=1 Tax=Euleptes europaea TaxID=460621 RepID=UPI00253FC115|nr:guanine nucleotide-binding protein-like 3 [Euleptes europaea]
MKRPKLKKASKRMTCHKRFKIQKKVREHNKKLRKQAKKRGHKKPKKDIGIPNAAPFKEDILREAEQRKQRREELKQQQKLDRQKEQEKKRRQEANKKDARKEKPCEKASTTKPKANSEQQIDKNSKKFICKELKKVIEASDVVLEVLDARDPLGCRCPQVEQFVCQSDGGKPLLLVLNKIDLIPKENLEKWLHYLNQELPTIAFKSAMQIKDKSVQVKKVSKRGAAYVDLSRASLCFGGDCLLKLLQEYSVVKEKVIQVGVVGFPNVGKSSVVNSMKEMRACHVGPVRGLTRCMQIVHIDKQIKMLDSPSIIVAPSSSPLTLALRSTTTDVDSGNVLDSAAAILKPCSKQQIMMRYNISDYRNPLEFFTLLAQKRVMLKKGGVLNTEGAAKVLLSDWTGAKVSYYSRPPASWIPSSHLSTEALAAVKQAFNFEDLEEDNKSTLKASKYPNQTSSIAFQSPGFTDGIIDDTELPEEVLEKKSMEVSEDAEELSDEEDEVESEEESNTMANSKTVSEELAAKNAEWGKLPTGKQLNTKASDLDDAYDFNTDYI